MILNGKLSMSFIAESDKLYDSKQLRGPRM